jgi:hypothetical protein
MVDMEYIPRLESAIFPASPLVRPGPIKKNFPTPFDRTNASASLLKRRDLQLPPPFFESRLLSLSTNFGFSTSSQIFVDEGGYECLTQPMNS